MYFWARHVETDGRKTCRKNLMLHPFDQSVSIFLNKKRVIEIKMEIAQLIHSKNPKGWL